MTKFTNPFLPKFDLVVTRHPALVEWLGCMGYIDGTPVVEHAHADRRAPELRSGDSWVEVVVGTRVLARYKNEKDAAAHADRHQLANVRGKHVVGVLPHHLSSQTASTTEVQLDWTQEDRAAMTRGDLGVEDIARAARGLHTYRVQKYSAGIRPEVAFARALDEAEVCSDGTSIKFLSNDHAALIEVSDFHGYRRIQVDLYKGALRTTAPGSETFGPWLDPLTDRPWQVASRIHHDQHGKLTNGPVRLVGGYPTDECRPKSS